ncbi:MAG: hypothetical protein HRT58_02350 [Crocinitomicaceae bacterium]|nr:hypothetical protein [Flavobacteriales bacterium]NQZ34469.1 hypothetical protein [Crocinitomicaceae bacterium]
MLPIIYIVFTGFVILIILLAYRKILHKMAIPARERSKKFLIATGFVFGWLAYLFIISLTGILKDLNLPPKFPLLIFLPLLIGFLIFYRSSKNSSVIKAIPNTWPVYFQSFRIVVELILLYTFYAGIIPESATFEGWNFDVLMGVSAPFVAYLLVQQNGSKGLLYLWNVIGIGMVLFVGYITASSMYFPQTWGSEVPLVNMTFIEMPYLLLAGFLAPLAIFMHVVSLIHLRN